MSLLNPEAEIYGINESLRSYSREQLCNWLAEQGVDVGLAVRIVTEANVANTEVVVVSADTDRTITIPLAQKFRQLQR